MFKMAILNIILLGLNFFFLIYEKKIENRSSVARPTFLWGERSETQRALGERSEQKSQRAKGEHHNSKAKAQIPGLKRKTSLTTKETKGAQTKHQEKGDPPMQGKGTRTARARAHKGHESPEPKGTKERKAKPRTGEPQPLPPRAPTQKEQENNKGAPEGAKADETKTKRGAKKHVKPIRKVIGFSRLACRERSERNAKREKTYIIFAGGTDAKIIKSISEGNTAYSLFY